MIDLAKQSLDVGLFTNSPEDLSAFWQAKAGVSFDHFLPVSRDLTQHRHVLSGAVLKINHSKAQLPPSGNGGFLRLVVACPGVSKPETLSDLDGNELIRWPQGRDGIEHWSLEVPTRSEAEFLSFYHEALGLPVDQSLSCAVACGQSRIVGRIMQEIPDRSDNDELVQTGIRYATIQVHDADAEYARITAHGDYAGRAPDTLGKTARIAFVRDPLGNWIEISQRASLTGSLPD